MLSIILPERNRMIAVQILGDMKSIEAIPAFKEILETQDDYYLVREIVISLEKIEGHDSRILIQKMKKHQSNLGQDACGENIIIDHRTNFLKNRIIFC